MESAASDAGPATTSPPPGVARRGLRVLLPAHLPPAVVRLASAFAAVDCDTGTMARLLLRGEPQDGYVIDEDAAGLVLLLRCGLTLRCGRDDVGLTWAPDPPTAPRSLAGIRPEYLSLAMGGPAAAAASVEAQRGTAFATAADIVTSPVNLSSPAHVRPPATGPSATNSTPPPAIVGSSGPGSPVSASAAAKPVAPPGAVVDFEIQEMPAELPTPPPPPPGSDQTADPPLPPAFGRATCHRRLRLLAPGETKREPTRAPFFVYAKIGLPYLRLLAGGTPDTNETVEARRAAARADEVAGRRTRWPAPNSGLRASDGARRVPAPHPEGSLREAAAYRLVAECRPAVAPTCFFATVSDDAVGEASLGEVPGPAGATLKGDDGRCCGFAAGGGSCLLLEDLAAWPPYRGTIRHRFVEKSTGATLVRAADSLPAARRVAAALAALHGPFLAGDEAAAQGHEKAAASAPRRRLRQAMAHEHIFYSRWAEAIAEADAGAQSAAAGAAAGASHDHRTVLCAYGVGGPADFTCGAAAGGAGLGAADAAYDAAKAVAARRSRLTLVHGRVCSDHVLLAPSARMRPDCVLLDWKAAGIGPLEVDLIHLFLTLPKEGRCAMLPAILHEYLLALQVLHAVAADLTLPALLLVMRDTARALVAARAFDWNCDGAWRQHLEAAHKQLVPMCTPVEIAKLPLR